MTKEKADWSTIPPVACSTQLRVLQNLEIDRDRFAGSFIGLNIEFDETLGAQGRQPRRMDHRDMDENILAADIGHNKTISLVDTKKLHCSLSHFFNPYFVSPLFELAIRYGNYTILSTLWCTTKRNHVHPEMHAIF